MTEFELIERYFNPLIPPAQRGEDCALLDLAPGEELAVSTDAMVAGRHFPEGAAADLVARRALAGSASDLAAMGARPLGCTLALTLPEIDPPWLAQLSRGLARGTSELKLPLLGGDTTRGPLTLTLTVLGALPRGQALRRGGGRPGESVWVSGSLGGAAAALEFPTMAPDEPLQQRYWLPAPRLELGQALRGLATAAIDLSDGLLADLGHLCRASGCGALIDPLRLPLHAQALERLGEDRARALALSGGDDYELCFASGVPAGQIEALGRRLGVALHRIGELVAEPGVSLVGAETPRHTGYQHFGGGREP